MGNSAPRRPWWTSAVFYQVYPRSFADGNGDGVGDLAGLRTRLDYLHRLGVDALWLSPFYRSPMADGGYDVADPCDVDPVFGTLADFDALLADAHARGIRVIIDIVPNHVSEQHPWFQAARAASPGSPERARFVFRPGRGPNGELPPNNWPSVFGGPAWTRIDAGRRDGGDDGGDGDTADSNDAGANGTAATPEWYLHLFAPEQPDLDWTNPQVAAEFDRVLRFWLDRGVDGFRIDVAHGMAKPAGLPDVAADVLAAQGSDDVVPLGDDVRWDRDEVHEIHRRFRRVIDSYPSERMAIGEVWVPDGARLALYVRPDELHLAFNFELVEIDWDAAAIQAAIRRSMAAMADSGAPCTWVLDNHDVQRAATRFGGGPTGLARARAAALVQLSLPGAVFIYNGDELGLANVDLPDDALQDPTWRRSGQTIRGRDGERVPLPWSGERASYGFSSTAQTWLPMPAGWGEVTVAAQQDDPASTLSLYRTALRLRRTETDLTDGGFAWMAAPDGCLGYRRGRIMTLLNAGTVPVRLPDGQLLLASGPLTGVQLPSDTAVWLRSAR